MMVAPTPTAPLSWPVRPCGSAFTSCARRSTARLSWPTPRWAGCAARRPSPGAGSLCRNVTTAQTRANLGDLVLAAFENPDPQKPGHIAIVRPGDIDTAALLADGPFVIQAGGHNALSVPLARGFANHKGAWVGGWVRFFAHAVGWASL